MKEIKYPKIQGVPKYRLVRMIAHIRKIEADIGPITKWTKGRADSSKGCPLFCLAPRYDEKGRQIEAPRAHGIFYKGKLYRLYGSGSSNWWRSLPPWTKGKINSWLKIFPWK